MPRNKKLKHPKETFIDKFICNWCQKIFLKRRYILAHLKKCQENNIQKPRSAWRKIMECKYCDTVVYGNEKTLEKHIADMHFEESTKEEIKTEKKGRFKIRKCDVCLETCRGIMKLRQHIRSQHFNLKAKLPYCDQKKVNQVWFEKVLNCNNIMEIRKTAPNTLVMRRLAENTAIKVVDQERQVVDLTHLYPTKSKA